MATPEVSPRRQWNVFASLTVLTVLAYFVTLAVGLFMGKLSGSEFVNAALPVVTGVIAGAVALLRKPDA